MDELKPDLSNVWDYLRRNPHLALSAALFLAGIFGLAFGVPAIAGALFGAGAALLGGWITLMNTQRTSSAEKARRESDAKRYLTPELKRVIDRLLFIHQRALANYSVATMDQVQPNDIQADFFPYMPVLYPNAPQFHDLTADDAVSLIGFYDSLYDLEMMVKDWYGRPTQLQVNIFTVMLTKVDRALEMAQICVIRFEIDTLYPAKHESVGTPSKQVDRCLSQSKRARDVHIERFNAQQAEEQRKKTVQAATTGLGPHRTAPRPGGQR